MAAALRLGAVVVWCATLMVLFVGGLGDSSISYDHQNTSYVANFTPVTVSLAASASATLTPFFSPEHSLDTLVSLIDDASTSVDIYTPSASSWVSACAGYTDDDLATCTPGCTPLEMKNESFPVFPALINAMHRGVGVRIITNDYGLADCDGTITMLQYLKLAGAEVRYFTTVTFVHAKFTSVDGGRRSAVSSINWSKASTTKNREAGAIVEGDDLGSVNAFMQDVFEFDWAQAYPLVPSDNWSTEDLATITDATDLAVVLPVIDLYPGLYETPTPTPLSAAGANVTVQASPDSAWDTLEAALAIATSSLEIAMYQVTTDDLCDQILDLSNSGVNVSLLVSSRIYDEGDCEDAQACYAKLYSGGLRFRKTSLHYSYSHNKYWIVDGKEVGWSTGNWSPSDYPEHGNVYPPEGSDDWWKTNRDFTLYTDSAAAVNLFQTVLWNDWYAPAAYDWEPEYDIYCGY